MATILQIVSNSVQGAGSGSITANITATTGSDLIVAVAGNDNAINTIDSTGVSDPTNGSYTNVKDVQFGGGGVGSAFAAIYRVKNITGGALVVTATASVFATGSFAATSITVYEVSGLDDTSASDGTASGSGFSGTISAGSITPSTSGDVIIAAMANTSGIAASQTVTAGTGFTLDFHESIAPAPGGSGANTHGIESLTPGTTSPTTCNFAAPASHQDTWAAVAVAFSPVPGHNISGTVSGTSSATITLSGAGSGMQTGGAYTFGPEVDGAYVLTPTETGFIFSPTHINVTLSGADSTGNDFTAIPVFAVSGNAGVASATVSYTGTSSGSTTAAGDGSYTLNLPAGTYTITPSKTGYSFAPTSRNVTVVASPISGQDFTATHLSVATPVITPGSAYIPGSATITLTDINSGLSGFAMYYTTDGTTPTTGSTLYSIPFTVTPTLAAPVTVKVLAVATSYVNSAIASAIYHKAAGGFGAEYGFSY